MTTTNTPVELAEVPGIAICPVCGEPAHAAESDDDGRCLACALNARVVAATAAAAEAFWASVAASFPEIKSGDFPPDAAADLTRALATAVSEWCNHNRLDLHQ